LKAQNPGNILSRDLWTYEGINFHAVVPANGVCPENTQPVIRLYNNRFAERDSNHRFTIDEKVVDEMVAKGWIREGVALCGAAQ
jgi:serine protease